MISALRCLGRPDLHVSYSDKAIAKSILEDEEALPLQRPPSLTGQSSHDEALDRLSCTVLLSVRHAYYLRLAEGIVAEGVVLGHCSHPGSNPKALSTSMRASPQRTI